MPKRIKFIAPLYVVTPRKTKADRKVIINLNAYRNWHYLVSNEIKKKYKEVMSSQLNGIVFDSPIKIVFKYFKASNRKSDRANVLSVHEKFFCDAMVELGCIEDDNDDYIVETKYISGGVDKENPRVEIYVSTLN